MLRLSKLSFFALLLAACQPALSQDTKTLDPVNVTADRPQDFDIVSQSPGMSRFAHIFDHLFSRNNRTPSNRPKNNKNGCPDTGADPVILNTGTKVESTVDFSLPGEMGLRFERFYNSSGVFNNTRYPWTTSFDYIIDFYWCGTFNCGSFFIIRPDGSSLQFQTVAKQSQTGLTPIPEIGGAGLATLVRNEADGSYTLHDEDGTTQVYGNATGTTGLSILSITDVSGIGWTFSYAGGYLGRVALVTHSNGQTVSFAYAPINTGGVITGLQTTVTDPAGNQYVYVLDNKQRYVQATLPGSPATVYNYQYNSQGYLAEIDVNGSPYAYTGYDGSGRVTSTYLAGGSQQYTIAYGSNATGPTTAITNPLGHTATNQYNSQQQLIGISDTAVSTCGATSNARSYDSNGNLSQTIDNNGNVHTYSYAANGQLQTETEAAGTSLARTTDYVWDPNAQLNRPLSITLEGVRKTTYTYNTQNRLASVAVTNLSANGNANQTLTTTYQYALYSNGMVQTMVVTRPSPSGSDTDTYHYDNLGNLTSLANGLGQAVAYGNYNGLGEPGSITGPNGDVVNYTYDARGRTSTKTTHPNGGSAMWSYGYDGFGLLSSVYGPDGQVTTWNRNQIMQVASITHNDKDGASTESFQYDPNGDVTQHTIARGSTTSLIENVTYDGLGRIYQRPGQHSQLLTYAYDGNGNVVSITNAAGHVTSHQYDALDRVTKTIESGGASSSVGSTAQATATISFSHDAEDHLTSVTDPRGLVTGYIYDGLGLLWQQTSPDTGTTSYNYDGNGRRSSMTRANGVQTTYNYDAISRITGISASGQSQSFTYDSCTNGIGRLCTAANAGGHAGYGYTPEGWISNRSFVVGSTTYALGYAYNAMGQISGVIYPDGNQAIYNYTNGVVSSISLNVGGAGISAASQIIYQPQDSAMASWVGSNGLTTSLYYDTDGRFTGANVPAVLTYGIYYDNADRVAKKQDFISPVLTENFGYDEQSRLVSETGGAENESYQYDANGNRISQTVNGTSMNLIYEGGSNRMINAGGVTFGYDALGNTTVSNGTSRWQFDPFNRMTTAFGNTYYIDPQGQRLMKSVSGTTTYFAPDENNHLMAENDAGAWVDYLWLNGRLIGRITAGQVQDIHVDQLGRPEAMTNASQTLVWRAMNFPFSRSVATNNAAPLNIGFPGQYFDAELNLWNNGSRDYFYWVGRYLESDPIGLDGGINTYTYVGNNPISAIDPLGLWRWPDYISVNLNIAIPTPWTGTLVGWSGTVSLDRYGDWFWSPLGGGVGKSATVVSGSLMANWLDRGCKPTKSQLSNFLSAHGFNATAGYGGGLSQSYTPGSGWATGIGLASPQIGASYNYSLQGGNTGGKW